MPNSLSPRERLIVALDMARFEDAEWLVEELGREVVFYKVGMELAYGGGLALVSRLVATDKKVFLDLKLHDIPNTVERATAQVARLGATYLTVHAYPQTMRAAVAGAAGSGLKLLAVTVLTSADDSDLAAAGYALGVQALVKKRGAQAKAAGIDGLVASAAEAAARPAERGRHRFMVTPRSRPAGAGAGDPKRVATPARAIADGADYLVVGRPITEAGDPRGAAEAIVAEIAAAAGN